MTATEGLVKPLFKLGQLVATPGAIDTFTAAERSDALKRHITGDWSEMDKHDQAENKLSVKEGYRVLSAYTYRGHKLWLITEWDRSVTTYLLPDEY